MENINHYYQMVDNIITSLGVDPAKCKGDKEGQWNLQKGSAPVWIDVWQTPDNYGYFQAMSPICEIPTVNTQAFFQEILEINHKLYGVGMTKYENWIYIKVIRELEGINESEMTASFNRIGFYADEYDDYLKYKYFGQRV